MKKLLILAIFNCFSFLSAMQHDIDRERSVLNANKILALCKKLEKEIGRDESILLAPPQMGSKPYEVFSEIWTILKRPMASHIVLQQLQFLKRCSYIVRADLCLVCGKESQIVCKACNAVSYCSDSHQKSDILRHDPIFTTDLSALTGECVNLRRVKFDMANHKIYLSDRKQQQEEDENESSDDSEEFSDYSEDSTDFFEAPKEYYTRKDDLTMLGKRSRKRD